MATDDKDQARANYLKQRRYNKYVKNNKIAKKESVLITGPDKTKCEVLGQCYEQYAEEEENKMFRLNIKNIINEIDEMAYFFERVPDERTGKLRCKKDILYEKIKEPKMKLENNNLEKAYLLYQKFEGKKYNELNFMNRVKFQGLIDDLGLTIKESDIIIDAYNKLIKELSNMGFSGIPVKEAMNYLTNMAKICGRSDFDWKVREIFDKYHIDLPINEAKRVYDFIEKRDLCLSQETELQQDRNMLINQLFHIDNFCFSDDEYNLAYKIFQQDYHALIFNMVLKHIEEPMIINIPPELIDLRIDEINPSYYTQKIEDTYLMEEEIDVAVKRYKEHTEDIKKNIEELNNVIYLPENKETDPVIFRSIANNIIQEEPNDDNILNILEKLYTNIMNIKETEVEIEDDVKDIEMEEVEEEIEEIEEDEFPMEKDENLDDILKKFALKNGYMTAEELEQFGL